MTAGLPAPGQVQFDNVACYSIHGQPASYLFDLVQQAQRTHGLLVLLFHGVGGGHALNEDAGAHRQLLRYLQAHEADIWVAPLVEVAGRIRASRPGGQ